MGYTKISIKSDEDIAKYYERTDADGAYFRNRRSLRRLGDTLLFLFAFVQIALVGYAALQTI